MWECGLKLCRGGFVGFAEMSLLMWECGLKPNRYNEGGVASKSLLMWECGLKRVIDDVLSEEYSHSLCGSVD